jgi:hypothetical protein
LQSTQPADSLRISGTHVLPAQLHAQQREQFSGISGSSLQPPKASAASSAVSAAAVTLTDTRTPARGAGPTPTWLAWWPI